MDNRLLKTTGLWFAALICIIVVFFFFFDRPVHQAALSLNGGAIYQAASFISLLADHDFFNVILFCCLMFIGVRALTTGFTPGLRILAYLCLAVLIAMVLGETLKWIFGRYRPQVLFNQGLYGFSFFAEKGSRHSFPSGHTLRIFSAMTAAAMVWPKARGCFISLAVLVGISRVLVTRHYPSDILAGAFLGVFTALWLWSIMRPDRPEIPSQSQPTII